MWNFLGNSENATNGTYGGNRATSHPEPAYVPSPRSPHGEFWHEFCFKTDLALQHHTDTILARLQDITKLIAQTSAESDARFKQAEKHTAIMQTTIKDELVELISPKQTARSSGGGGVEHTEDDQARLHRAAIKESSLILQSALKKHEATLQSHQEKQTQYFEQLQHIHVQNTELIAARDQQAVKPLPLQGADIADGTQTSTVDLLNFRLQPTPPSLALSAHLSQATPPSPSRQYGKASDGANKEVSFLQGKGQLEETIVEIPHETSKSFNVLSSKASTGSVISNARMVRPNALHASHIDTIKRLSALTAHQKAMRFSVEGRCSCLSRRQQGCIYSFVDVVTRSGQFNFMCALITLTFALLMGLEADLNIKAALKGEENPQWVSITINAFNIWFIAEVLIRLFAERMDYFLGPEYRWNVLDFTLAMLTIPDLISSMGSVGFMRLLRGVKVVRTVRVVRVLRIFTELRVMTTSMLISLGSLFWSLVFLILITYLFAVGFLQGAESFIRDNNLTTGDTIDGLRQFYRTLFKGMYTLVCCITGGTDWATAADPMFNVGVFYGLGFVLFVLISVLGVLNVVTSVFVERASNMKSLDRDFAIAQELRDMESDVEATVKLFQELDVEGKGEFRTEEFRKFINDDHFIAHFATIGVDVTDTALMEKVFDGGGTGFVTIDSFVLNCLSMRGQAKATSTMSILLELRKLHSAFNRLEQRFRLIDSRLKQSGLATSSLGLRDLGDKFTKLS